VTVLLVIAYLRSKFFGARPGLPGSVTKRGDLGMHILVMTFGRHSSHMISETLKHLRLRRVDHTVAIPGSLLARVRDNQVEVLNKTGKRIEPDLVLNATSAELGAEIVDYFELIGVPVVNPVWACRIARNKPLTSMYLAAAGIRTPNAVMADQWGDEISALLRNSVGLPCVAKPRDGAQGKGVYAYREWAEVAHRYHQMPQPVYIQSYVPNKGYYYRVYVVDDQVIVAHYYDLVRHLRMEMTTESELPGRQRCQVTPELADIAIKATAAVGLSFAALDIITDPSGFEVIEVNSWSNGKDAEKICQLSIAGALVDYLIKRAITKQDKTLAQRDPRRNRHPAAAKGGESVETIIHN
jgi:[lysine-biosynthesis-protein LysW]--L-2-aminoadipate ligase